MFLYMTSNLSQFRRAEAVVSGERDRLKPELCFEIVARSVNVGRFVVFPAVKVKSVGSNTKHRRHILAGRKRSRSRMTTAHVCSTSAG